MRNIILDGRRSKDSYSGKRKPVRDVLPIRSNAREHGQQLLAQFENLFTVQHKELQQDQVAAIRKKDGLYVQVMGQQGYKLITRSLESKRDGVRLCNIQQVSASPDSLNETLATIFIPNGKEKVLLKKIEAYIKSSDKEIPTNNKLVSSIEKVVKGDIYSLWTGDKNLIPNEQPIWCEVWLRADNSEYGIPEDSFNLVCNQLGIQTLNDSTFLHFPERSVGLIFANHNSLFALIEYCPYLAEIRKAQEINTFFLDMPRFEQAEWIKEFSDKTRYKESNVSICILDTGVNHGHPLLSHLFDDDTVQAVKDQWRADDQVGHGSGMAGVCGYNDLYEALAGNGTSVIHHKLESVKILSQKPNEPELYGLITAQAVAKAEIARPDNIRSFCMAITAKPENTNDGAPSSWSAEIDAITSGASDGQRRLFFVSAGNVCPTALKGIGYPEINRITSIEDPGQSWNCITVGAYTEMTQIQEPLYKGYYPVANKEGLSPYSTTSYIWDKKWPIKPDILCEGGNIATNGIEYSECPNLSLLTTNNSFLVNYFSTIWATSAATAQAAWMASQISAEYPSLWPETIRALLVSSASWTEDMIRHFRKNMKKSDGIRQLLRCCGYGRADLRTAIESTRNSVNMIVQDEMQPYSRKSSSYIGMNEMHLHHLPWPSEFLEELENTSVTVKIVLSYFIEPGPGEIGWKDKYRYPSCGLRFDMNKTGEKLAEFQRRINVLMTANGDDDEENQTGGPERWELGENNRNSGSLQCDIWNGSAIELSHSEYIAIYPVVGWWKERHHLGKYDKRVRYALVVKLSTPEESIDLYTRITNIIKTPVTVPLSTGRRQFG